MQLKKNENHRYAELILIVASILILLASILFGMGPSSNSGETNNSSYITEFSASSNQIEHKYAYINFHNLEYWDNTPTRWMSNNGTIVVYSNRSCDCVLSFNAVSFYEPRNLQIYVNNKLIDEVTNISEGSNVNINIKLNEGRNLIIFYSATGCQRPIDISELNNLDGRYLSIAFQNIAIQPADSDTNSMDIGFKSLPLERISIDIKNEDFQKLEQKREIAIKEGILFASNDDYVPAKIHYNDRTIKVKLRLKGDWTDHLKGDRWSFRIEVNGDDTLFGMKTFSIQDPSTRSYLNEWIFQKALLREGILAPRYSFIDVTLNGEHKGIYALEEHFDKILIEHNNYREGPIVRFNEDLFWESMSGTINGINPYFSSDIDAFQTSNIMEDPVKYEQFIKAKDLLVSFQDGNLKTSDVFDVNKLSKFMALSDLMGAEHGTRWHNSRFYYNPVTSKLEPIGFDSGTGMDINTHGLTWMEKNTLYDQYKEEVFKDPIFFESYVRELERVSQKSYLDNMFEELGPGLEQYLAIIETDSIQCGFSKEVYYNNQKYIQTMLNPSKCLNVYFCEYQRANRIVTLEVGNIQQMPIEILELSYKGQTLEPKEKTVLYGKKTSNPTNYEKIEFVVPTSFIWDDNCIQDLKLHYRLLGIEKSRSEIIHPWQHISEDFPTNDFMRQSPNCDKFDFLFIDKDSKTIILKPGTWELTENLIIPAGHTFICRGDGKTMLDLKNNAKVLSYSPLYLVGNEDYPITITSSDSTGQGIVVLDAGSKSILNKVIFKNLSAPSQDGWQLSGSVTFYNSDVDIEDCQFLDNRYGDDMLDLVRSRYSIRNSLFKNILFDALDDDFGVGTVSYSSFINCGNDALDFSGAVVNVDNVFVNGTGDKGVSGGEDSQISVNNAELKNCNIAVASKDQSVVNLNNIEIKSCDIGFTAYQKKPEFGPAKVVASSVDMSDVGISHIIEVNSILHLNGEEIKGTKKEVYRRLYGEQDI